MGAFRRYLRRSIAEFGVAKHGYVASRCGWFSERSANYLASVGLVDESWLPRFPAALAERLRLILNDPEG